MHVAIQHRQEVDEQGLLINSLHIIGLIYYSVLYPVSRSTALAAGVTLGVVGAVLLISLAVLGLCMLPRCPLRKAYSREFAPDPDVVRADEESGRRSIATVPQLQ